MSEETLTEKLLEHHMADEEKWFEEMRENFRELKAEIRSDIKAIREELEGLREFKIQTKTEAKTDAKWTALIASGIMGLLSLVGSVLVNRYIK